MEIIQLSQKILYSLNFIFKTYPEKFYIDLSSNNVKNPLPVIKCVSEYNIAFTMHPFQFIGDLIMPYITHYHLILNQISFTTESYYTYWMFHLNCCTLTGMLKFLSIYCMFEVMDILYNILTSGSSICDIYCENHRN
jgi:hypothetical protein